MTLQEYLQSLREKTVAVIGIGVSNTPLIRLLLQSGISVTACVLSLQVHTVSGGRRQRPGEVGMLSVRR